MLSVLLHRLLPSFAVIELHPIIIPILDLPSVFQRLGEEIAQVVVVWSILKTEVSHVTQIFVEFLC